MSLQNHLNSLSKYIRILEYIKLYLCYKIGTDRDYTLNFFTKINVEQIHDMRLFDKCTLALV